MDRSQRATLRTRGGSAEPLPPSRPDAELLDACAAFTRAEQEVARLDTADDEVFEPAVAIAHATVVRVAGCGRAP